MDHPLRRPHEILAYRSLRQILAARPKSLWFVGPTDYAITAIRLMAEKNIGFIVVMERGRIAQALFFPNVIVWGALCLPAGRPKPLRSRTS